MKWVAVVCLVLSSSLVAEEPEAVYKQGIAKLRDAQSDHAALVPATKLLAQAAALYEAAGDEAKTAEVNSCLYWAKKKMTLADTEAVKGDAVAVQRIETVAKAIPASEAKAMLDKAEAFAKGHADDPLLTAIRYFEVGDRFPETAEGRNAIQQSLAAMQKVGEKAKLEAYKPAATDGQAFIKSEPPGAAIVLVAADGGKMDTGKVTPAIVRLPVGKQTLELTLTGRKAVTLAVEVDRTAIAEPEVAMFERRKDGNSKIVVEKCDYGAATAKIDLTATIQAMLDKDPYVPITTADNIFGDPAPRQAKRLVVKYRFNGVVSTENLGEGESVVIPRWPKEGMPLSGTSKEFKIIAARFGAGTNWLDVTRRIAAAAKGPNVPFLRPELGDPLPGVHKTLAIWFDYQGRRYSCLFGDGSNTLLLPTK